MSRLERARADLETACVNFNNAANSSTPPGALQESVRDLMFAVDEWAELRRSGRSYE